ncbi:protein Rep [Listeria phage LIS04]|nr:protein Rep [Listeria phage LIS04]
MIQMSPNLSRAIDSPQSCGEIFRQVNGKIKPWFCKSPICPYCATRKHRSYVSKTTSIVSRIIESRPDYRWVMLKLEITNPRSLSDIRHLHRSFAKLFNYKKIQNNIVGYTRKSQVVGNSKSYKLTAHVLLCVSKSYFRSGTNYIKASDWSSYWKKAVGTEFSAECSVKVINLNKYESEMIYTPVVSASTFDFLSGSISSDLEIAKYLESEISGSRMTSYSGVFQFLDQLETPPSNLANFIMSNWIKYKNR